MNKQELRKIYLQKRKQLTPPEMAELNAAIINNFASLNLTGIRFIHIFYPITGKHEFNSLLLVDWLKENHPEIELVLPKTILADFSLKNILWQSNTPLGMNQWGITEPESGIEIDSARIDMVLLPLLAYDKSGNRLGYGKGFYDRFLINCKPDVQKIGISYFEPEEIFEEIDAYDIPLNACVTPKRIWKFGEAAELSF